MIYDIDSLEKIKEINNDFRYFNSLCYINESTIAVGNNNGSINIYSLESNKRIFKIEEHCLTVRSLNTDNINNRLISCSDDLHINIYDSNTFKVITPLVGHKDFISSIIVNNDKNVYASSSYDGTIKLWDIRLNNKISCVETIDLNTETECNLIWDISFSADGLYLIAGTENGFHLLTRI